MLAADSKGGRMSIEWEAESLRLSVFSASAVAVTDLTWGSLTGQPEAENRKLVPGGKVLSGPHMGAFLNLAGVQNRADLIISTPATASGEKGLALPSIGKYIGEFEKFFALGSVFIKTLKAPLVRIAFGGVLV